MASFLVGTDVLINFLRGDQVACHLMKENADSISLSVVIVAEIYAGIRGEKETQIVELFFSTIPILEITQPIAQKAGIWVAQFGRSHAVALPDALIAATAQQHDLELKTLNIKHFPMFKGLVPAYRI
ncbi:MAG: type II toxin-antitoxin system VapC family toxin [Nitrospirota bacterium]